MNSLVLVMVRVVLGFMAAFLSILVWSKTREYAWLLMTAAILLDYVGVLFEALTLVGITAWDSGIAGVSLLGLLFQGGPFLLFGAAFIGFLWQQRRF